MGNGLVYEVVALEVPALSKLLQELRSVLVNGGALAARFRVVRGAPAKEAWWFRTSSNLSLNQSFQDVLDSTTAREALPELQLPQPWPASSPPAFSAVPAGTLTLDGELAHALVRGGAYRRFSGSGAEAKALARRAALR